MNKTIKKVVVTVTTGFALLGAGGTVLAANGYIEWKGSKDFTELMVNLDLINDRGQVIKTENEQLEVASKDKDGLIDAKTQEIERLTKENEQLRESTTNESNELKQAEKDMKEANKKSDEILKELNK